MNVPEVVVFDLGKVLVDFDYGIAARKLAKHCENGLCDLPKIISTTSPILLRYETGFMTTEEFFSEVRSLAKFTGRLEEFSAIFADIFTPIVPMVEINEKLRASGVPTYIFSNTNPLAIEHIRDKFPFFRNFTAYILSYEHGSMKPESRLYEVVEKTTGRSGDAILYLDDRPENVAAGAQRGWKTILHEQHETTRRQMRASGLLNSG